jgi:hypothetical protein
MRSVYNDCELCCCRNGFGIGSDSLGNKSIIEYSLFCQAVERGEQKDA